jgi:hypothetical protein
MLLGLSLIMVVGLGVMVWLGFGRPVMLGRPEQYSTLSVSERLDALKVVLAVVGGIGAIVALTVAYRKQRDGEIAEYREETKAFAERFGRAVDQLGHAECAVRAGGVYAVAELADEWEDGRQICIDMLCAYLRMPYEPDPTKPGHSAGNKVVRQILIRVIRNHLRDGWTSVSWRGYRFSFEGAVFDGGDLHGARFTPPELSKRGDEPPVGNVTFHGARFVSGWFGFGEVDFGGTQVWFERAEFAGAHVTFRRARFRGSRVSFDRAKVTGGKVEFDGAAFEGGEVSFEDLDVSGGAVSFDGATRSGGTVHWGPFQAIGPATVP